METPESATSLPPPFKKELSARLPSEIFRVPRDCGGLYVFTARFPTDYELGLTADSPRLDLAEQAVLQHLEKLAALTNTHPLSGRISDRKLGLHLRESLSIVANHHQTYDVRSELQGNNLFSAVSEAKEVAGVLRICVSMMRPLYVGMAERQSLRDRLKQHMDGETGLLDSLSLAKLSILDLEFHWVPLSLEALPHARALEKVMQHILRPAFSKN